MPSDNDTVAAPIAPEQNKALIQAAFGAGNMNQGLSHDGFSLCLVMG
jgi:hypothetical protein